MKIADIDVVHMNAPIAARNADQKARFERIDTQTLFRVVTDNGIVGYGNIRCFPESSSSRERIHCGCAHTSAPSLNPVLRKYRISSSKPA